MRNIWTIIKREYKDSVFKKSFIIGTIIGPVIMLSFIFVPALLIDMEVEKPYHISVIDFSGIMFDRLQERLNEKLPDGRKKFNLIKIETNHDELQAVKTGLKKEIINEKIDGFLIIPESIKNAENVEYYAKNVANLDLNRQLRSEINDIIINMRIEESGLDADLVNSITKRVGFKTIKIKKGEEESERGFGEEYLGTFAFVFILYLTILL